MSNLFFGDREILHVAEAVSRDEAIPYENMIKILEEAIRVSSRKKYGHDLSVRVHIDRTSGEIKFYHDMLVVSEKEELVESDSENIDNEEEAKELTEEEKRLASLNKITLEEAKVKFPEAKLDEVVSEELPPIDLERGAAQVAKQVMVRNILEFKKKKEFAEYVKKVGQIFSGYVDKVERKAYIVKIGTSEAYLPIEQTMKIERFKKGDRVKVYLQDVVEDNFGPQLMVSRTDNNFLKQLFTVEVPEIYEGLIEVKAVARDPGSRSKMAVFTAEKDLDPVGSCVGIRGSRVKAVMAELNGEKIDIIQWTEDEAQLAVRAMAPIEISKVIVDEDENRIELIIPEDKLSIAIGRRGQNIRLISNLIGKEISVTSEGEEVNRNNSIVAEFMESLDLDEMLSQLLVAENFSSIKGLAETDVDVLAGIPGLDKDIAEELITRAQNYLELLEQKQSIIDELMQIAEIDESIAEALYNEDIMGIKDLSTLSLDDLKKVLETGDVKEDEIDSILKQAKVLANKAS